MKKIKLSKEVIEFLENHNIWKIYIPTESNENPKYIKMFVLGEIYYIETNEKYIYSVISTVEALRYIISNALTIDKDYKLIEYEA